MFRKMLDNNHVELRIVKNNAVTLVDDTASTVDSEEILHIAKDLVRSAAIAGVIVMSAGAVLHALSQIAVIVAEAGINHNHED